MKHVLGIVVCALVLIGSSPTQAAPEKVEGVDTFVNQWVKHFGERDATALAGLIDNSVGTLFVMATGQRYRSKDEYVEAQGAVFSGMDALAVSLKWQEFKTFDDRIVWGAFYFTEDVDYGDETLRFGMVQSVTLVKRQEGWRLLMLHESVTAVLDE
ncbi:nuclear transport factor 2 family protein [bacterium]|nr:nuclear transport factor 2 family protein [bacterium]